MKNVKYPNNTQTYIGSDDYLLIKYNTNLFETNETNYYNNNNNCNNIYNIMSVQTIIITVQCIIKNILYYCIKLY